MSYKKIAAVLLLIIIGIISISVLNNNEEEYFKQIGLPTDNTIINNLNHSHYYDTILAVGMNSVGLSETVVVIESLNDVAKNQFNGELNAHIRLHNGIYYLFLGSLNRTEAIKVIAHEIVHIQQYNSKELIYENEKIKWQGEDFTFVLSDEYEKRPWEIDAFNRQSSIITSIYNTLY